MEDSVYGDITSRALIQHASQEIPQNNTPLPVLQPTSKKRSTKRPRSALTARFSEVNVSPRTLIDNTNKEKDHRKSSAYIPKEDEILQLQQERRRSRKSLHGLTDLYDDGISVDENEVTEERSVLPDIADISAIAGCHKKQKLQLGKLDNRAYSKITDVKKTRSKAVTQSPLEEDYDGSFWNDELSSSLQQNSRANIRTRENVTYSKSDQSLSDSTSNVNLNTKAVKGSPLAEKQKPFTEKRIPHLSSDSDATFHGFRSEMDGRKKNKIPTTPKTTPNVLSVTHPMPLSGTVASSRKKSSNSQSPARTVSNILSEALHSERSHTSALSVQKAQTSKFARVSKHGTLSHGYGDDAEDFSDEEEGISDNNKNINLQDADEPAEILKMSSHHKSVSRRRESRPPSEMKSHRPLSPNPDTNSDEEEGNEAEDLETSNDADQFVEISKVSTTTSLVPQKSVSQILSASRKAIKSHQNVPLADISASVPHSPAKMSSVSLPYNITSQEDVDMHRVSHISTGSASDMEETEAEKNETVFAGIAQGSELSESVSSHQQKSTSRSSRGTVRSSSSSYKIINPPGIDMYASPRIVEDASYQLPHQTKRINTPSRDAAIVSRKTGNSRKMSETGHLPSPSLSMESSVSDPVHRKMHSTAIHDNALMMETIHESSPQSFGDLSSEESHKAKIFSKRKISHIPKAFELQKSSLPSRSSASDGIREKKNSHSLLDDDSVEQDCTHQMPHQNDISGKKSISTSRTDKHPVQLSDREQTTSPTPAIRSRVSGTARKSMCSSATFDHGAAAEDALHQQQTEELGRKSQKSVGTPRKEGYSARMSDHEESLSPASPCRPRVSGTVRNNRHSSTTLDHDEAIEDTLHKQQTEVPGRKSLKSVGTPRKDRYSARMSDQEKLPSPASPHRSRVSGTARKSRDSSATLDYEEAIEDTLHKQQTEVPGRKSLKSVGTPRKDRHSEPVSDQEESSASPHRSRVSRTARKSLRSSAILDHVEVAEDVIHQQQSEVPGRKSRKSVGISRKDRYSAPVSDQEQSLSPASPPRSRVLGTARKSLHSSAILDHDEVPKDVLHQQQTEVSGRKSGRFVGTSKKDRCSALGSDREESPRPASPPRPRISGTSRKSMHLSSTLDHDAAVEHALYQQQTEVLGRKSQKSARTSIKDGYSAQVSDREESPSPASPPKSRFSGAARKSMHSYVTLDHTAAGEVSLQQQQTEITGRKSRKSVGTPRKDRRSAHVSDREEPPSPASPLRSRASTTTMRRMHSDAVIDYTATTEDMHQVFQQTEIFGRKSAGTSEKERHSAQLSDQRHSPGPMSPVRSRVSGTARKSMHSTSAAKTSLHQVSQLTKMPERKSVRTSSKPRHSAQMSDEEQSRSPASPVRTRVSGSDKKRKHSDTTSDHNKTPEDSLYQLSQQIEISGRKSVGTSRKEGHSTLLLSNQEQSASQTLLTESRISRTGRMSMKSATVPDHNATAEDAMGKKLQQTVILGRKSVDVSRKDRRSAQLSEKEQSTSPTSLTRSRISGTQTKSMYSAITQDHNAEADEALCQVSTELSGRKSVSPSRKEGHSAQPSEQEQRESPIRSRVSRSSRKRMHSAANFDSNVTAQRQISGESSSEMPNETVIHNWKTANTTMKSSRTTRTPQLGNLTASSVRSSISDSIKRKMHSTAIPDHDTLMKTTGDRLVSPIRTKEVPIQDRSQRKLAPVVPTDFDEEAAERSSVASSVESEQSSDERMHERDLPLPAAVQNHDQATLQPEEEEEPAPRVQHRKKKTTVPRISSNETKKILENFGGMRFSRGALNTVIESCDLFWQKTFETVETYAKHAHRNTIAVQDVELLLYRQRLADDRKSMNALIAQYMPMELRRKVIPMATPGNIVIP